RQRQRHGRQRQRLGRHTGSTWERSVVSRRPTGLQAGTGNVLVIDCHQVFPRPSPEPLVIRPFLHPPTSPADSAKVVERWGDRKQSAPGVAATVSATPGQPTNTPPVNPGVKSNATGARGGPPVGVMKAESYAVTRAPEPSPAPATMSS